MDSLGRVAVMDIPAGLPTFSALSARREPKIGFIGQGWIGKNYADDFERRGYEVVRYALEAPYAANKDAIAACDIVFIAVPTPTTPAGFDASAVRAVLPLVGGGAVAVIKSTLEPGLTHTLQQEHPKIVVVHSPEFLSRGTAAHDAANPDQNIIGIPEQTAYYRARAEQVLSVLPQAPAKIVSSNTSELFKYLHNSTLFAKSVFMNLHYDLAQALNVEWGDIQALIERDPMLAQRIDNISHWHITPVHKGGRGIGGDCHIKDFETFARTYHTLVGDPKGDAVVDALKQKNIQLLVQSNKDLHLLRAVYGLTQASPSPRVAWRWPTFKMPHIPDVHRLIPKRPWVEWTIGVVGILVIVAGALDVAVKLAAIL